RLAGAMHSAPDQERSTGAARPAGNMKLVQVADIHVGAADPDVLAAAAASIREQDADALVVCGDMTQRGKREEFRVARDWVDSFRIPTIVVPGNHDTPLLDMVARVTSPFG